MPSPSAAQGMLHGTSASKQQTFSWHLPQLAGLFLDLTTVYRFEGCYRFDSECNPPIDPNVLVLLVCRTMSHQSHLLFFPDLLSKMDKGRCQMMLSAAKAPLSYSNYLNRQP